MCSLQEHIERDIRARENERLVITLPPQQGMTTRVNNDGDISGHRVRQDEGMNNTPSLPENFRLNLSNQINQVSQINSEFEAAMESIAEVKREEYEREERNSDNLQLTAQVLNGMLAKMQEEAENAAERDRQAQDAAKKNYRVAKLSMIFAALALAVPVCIELAKLIWT